MTTPFLSRPALTRVLTSLLQSELKALGRRRVADGNAGPPQAVWPETLQFAGDEMPSLHCDSLDVLRLAAAVNEMFHLHEAAQELGLLSSETLGNWLDSIEEAWQRGVGKITFTTSGSTGTPKRCTHEFAYLLTEITYLGEVFADRTRIIPLAPAHHIYGFLFTAMLPDHLRLPVHAVDNGERSGGISDLRHGDLLVSFPDRWQWLDRTIARWPEGVAGVVSTAPCPAELAASLMEHGLGSLFEVYGSSETAGIGLRRWPETKYQLMPQWRFENVSRDGVSDTEGAAVVHSSGAQVRLKDHVNPEQDGSFTLGGRIDAAVQVGGINVYPARVAEALRTQPGVQDAAVRVAAFGEGGRLKAFVVPQPQVDATELQRQLEGWMRNAFSPAEQVKSFSFGPALPKDAMGKDRDW